MHGLRHRQTPRPVNVPNDILDFVRSTLDGPFGGIIGGAVSFWLLDLLWKRRRERFSLAEAIAAELYTNAEKMRSLLEVADRNEVSEYQKTYRIVFEATAGQLGTLDFVDVATITQTYGRLNDVDRMPTVWRARADRVEKLPTSVRRQEEVGELRLSARSFYGVLEGICEDCEGLAMHLRTKYAIGWRGLVPLRFRPKQRASLPEGRGPGPD